MTGNNIHMSWRKSASSVREHVISFARAKREYCHVGYRLGRTASEGREKANASVDEAQNAAAIARVRSNMMDIVE